MNLKVNLICFQFNIKQKQNKTILYLFVNGIKIMKIFFLSTFCTTNL